VSASASLVFRSNQPSARLYRITSTTRITRESESSSAWCEIVPGRLGRSHVGRQSIVVQDHVHIVGRAESSVSADELRDKLRGLNRTADEGNLPDVRRKKVTSVCLIIYRHIAGVGLGNGAAHSAAA
jgi:hypothetical protein